MKYIHSPLRYPGGKSRLARFLSSIIKANQLQDGIYVEPYAGGAGSALGLLFSEQVGHIMINDIDERVIAFWTAILEHTDRFLAKLNEIPINIEEWNKQRKIYRSSGRFAQFSVGFATFYLNRCNRSGILTNAGPIGGRDQTGKWKIDARFNKTELARRIVRISLYKERISVFNMDALDFIKKKILTNSMADRALVYLDPPYYAKGRELYLNYYQHEDHANLAKFIKRHKRFKWVLSYDNVAEIRKLYSGLNQFPFDLNYSAQTKKVGSELLIYNNEITILENASKFLKISNDSLLVA